MDPLHTIPEMLQHIHANYSNPKALNGHRSEGWETFSTEEMLTHIKEIALGLVSLGLQKGARVGILADPSPQWTITDLAIIAAGGVTVPLFVNLSDDNYEYEISQTELEILFVGGQDRLELFSRNSPAKIKTVISFTLVDSPKEVFSYDAVRSLGAEMDKRNPKAYDELCAAARPDDLATIIYSSGTTGQPKGVELTQGNLTALLHANYFSWDHANDRYLNALPLAHVFGRLLNYCLITWGVSVYYTHDIRNFGALCKEVHPTILVVVPRLLEKVYAKMLSNVEHAGFMKRKVGLWAFELANHDDHSLFKTLLHPIADKIVYSALRDAMGGSLRVVISGGAPLNPHLCRFFIDIGVPIYEGWGLTEASTVCVNNVEKRKLGSVGTPIGPMKVKTSPEGELLVHGGIVMRGYYKNPTATAAVLDSDGWLHTGDKGIVDEEGFVFIKGRLKEMYKTSTGEYVAPVPIEQELCKAPLIDMALVIGQDRKFVSVLVLPDMDVLHSLKTIHKQEGLTDEEFLQSPYIHDEMHALIEHINQHLNKWEQIRAFRFILQPLTVESGELTPSMKIRREFVAQKYKALIDDMYPEEIKI